MCSVDTQAKVADAGKCWQMRQEGSGNLSPILGESPGFCNVCVVYKYKCKNVEKSSYFPVIELNSDEWRPHFLTPPADQATRMLLWSIAKLWLEMVMLDMSWLFGGEERVAVASQCSVMSEMGCVALAEVL